jgi:hypothetical protein
MSSAEHLHLPSIVDNLSERHVKEELFRVTEMAREMCGRLEAKHPTTIQPAVVC